MSPPDYARSSATKRADTAGGHQFSRQPADVAAKVAPFRQAAGDSKAALLAEARRRGLPGRSRMSKEALRDALNCGG